MSKQNNNISFISNNKDNKELIEVLNQISIVVSRYARDLVIYEEICKKNSKISNTEKEN